MCLWDWRLDDFEFGHILNIDAAESNALIVDDDKVINIVRFVELEDVDGKHIGGEGNRVKCHYGIDGFFE